MPITVGKFQCNICDDIFEATFSTWDETFTKCKCGQSEINPHQFGYGYKNGNEVKVIEKSYYYVEDEFVKFPKNIQAIYDQIKKIKEDNGYKYFLHEMTDKGKDGERYLSAIKIEYSESVRQYSNEYNEVSMYINLRKNEYQGDEVTENRLKRFLNFINKIESEELKVSDRNKMIDLAENEDINYRSEPTGEVNYKFYF